MDDLVQRLSAPGRTLVSGAPEGHDARLLADIARAGRDVLFVARDDVGLRRISEALSFFAPDVERLDFPAWDCLPYDRVSPNGEIVARRIDALTRLLEPRENDRGRIVCATVAGATQRIPPREAFSGASLSAKVGDRVAPDAITDFLARNGYARAETVMEPGEYAMRGGILDVFPSGAEAPVRLDFFGDELDGLRAFDPASQRTTEKIEGFALKPVSEVILDEDAIARFRGKYRALFGAVQADDALYEAVSAGLRHIGMEHWLPLFHEKLETLFDYLPGAVVALDHQADEALDARRDQVAEYYAARTSVVGTGVASSAMIYNPVPPDALFLDADAWEGILAERAVAAFDPFAAPEGLDAGGRPGREFADARVNPDVNVFDAVADHLTGEAKARERVLVAAFTMGSRDRLRTVLAEHGVDAAVAVETWEEAQALPKGAIALAVLGMERGFTAEGLSVVSEQDILGDRLARAQRRDKIKPENIIAEASALNEGDLVVHADHGVGRFEGLETITAGGAPHDCIRLTYAGEDRLYLPVENIELISRYGSETAGAQLDKLGGVAWQARKSKLKDRIREMAGKLIKVAASRELRPAPSMAPPEGAFDEFCAGFPFAETEDQARAISDAVGDLGRGRPMDRLVCGDVGFGKTEVALRAAFVAAMSGRQVAVVAPTTLLCRQHFQTFRQRFAGLPIRVEQLSRLVTPKRTKLVKEGLADGTVDIIIGTHALLAKTVAFRDLALLVVDEEQHFGVRHKERLKALKADVHVLTLTATPIPRTLQLAMSGVREMSLIATPPVDRLAVRTFVLPFDPVVIREAIMRERFRGGQTFYVCPRIEDLDEVRKRLDDLVPEAKVITAHGRMSATDLEAAVSAFYDGKYDILLSTNIVESGLDLPRVNTIVIHRADMFGLAGLYQLRGRVGRSKIRAYAYLTLPVRRVVTAAAKKRLEVMQTLDTLGAGFTLASHDLDIRGAGNLLGEEQSGHIREVGIELYQQMLEEAVAEARGGTDGVTEEEWSPQINVGIPVLIPDTYIAALNVRLGLYRRLATLADRAEIDAFAAELIDRFGPLPSEVENLLEVVSIKQSCRAANVSKIDAGPKGAVVSFRNDMFANPAGLIAYVQRELGVKLRPDHKLVFKRGWDDPEKRMKGARRLAKELAEIASA